MPRVSTLLAFALLSTTVFAGCPFKNLESLSEFLFSIPDSHSPHGDEHRQLQAVKPTKQPIIAPTKKPINSPTVDPSSNPTVSPTKSIYELGNSFSPFCKKTNGAPANPTDAGIAAVYLQTLKAVINGQSTVIQEQSDLFGKAMRLAFHDAGEFDRNSNDMLGPDGCIDFAPASIGLLEPDSPVTTYIEPLWQNVCDKISRADFWAMFGKIIFEYAQFKTKATMITTPYAYGRVDNKVCSGGSLRLPFAENAGPEIQRTFVDQMGLTVADAVTLIGAHTVGHVHPENSGYGRPVDTRVKNNAWDITPNIFDNGYFVNLLFHDWINQPVNQKQVFWRSGFGLQIMLNTDMFLAFDIFTFGEFHTGMPGELCGHQPNTQILACWNTSASKVYEPRTTATLSKVQAYADPNTGNDLFLQDFAASYAKMTSVGYGVGGNKLGTLKPINLVMSIDYQATPAQPLGYLG